MPVVVCTVLYCVVPTAAPEGLSASIASDENTLETCIVLRWAPPPADALNGVLTGYALRYAPLEQIVTLFSTYYTTCAMQRVRRFLLQKPPNERFVPYDDFFHETLSASSNDSHCKELTAAELDRLPRAAHVSVPASATSARVCNHLLKWTLYFVWVAAVNRVGTGVYSQPTLTLTPESGARCSLSVCPCFLGFLWSFACTCM